MQCPQQQQQMSAGLVAFTDIEASITSIPTALTLGNRVYIVRIDISTLGRWQDVREAEFWTKRSSTRVSLQNADLTQAGFKPWTLNEQVNLFATSQAIHHVRVAVNLQLQL
jgi:hypothetical protein